MLLGVNPCTTTWTVFGALRVVKFRPNLKLKTMKAIFCLTVGLAVTLAVVCTAQARNDKYLLPIKLALESTEAHDKPDRSVKFFFGKQPTPAVVTNLGTVTFHGKVNTLRSDDVKACNAAFLAALADFQKRAQKAGANGVIDIVSYYKNVEMASPTEFECHAGAAAHAILRGDLVKIADE
jgi:hypothetical protein